MSIESPITAAYGWHRFETKALAFTITDASDVAVNLTGVSLQWLLLRQAGDAESRAYINKTSATISGGSSNIATVTVDDSEYDTVEAGYYYYELWDRDNDVLLAYADAVLLPGTKDEA